MLGSRMCVRVWIHIVGVRCRNPLHALTDSANFIMESCKPDDAIYEDVSIIVSGALQMSRLLVSIMDWSKVSVGQLELRQADVRVNAFLTRLAGVCRRACVTCSPVKPIAVSLSVSPGVPAVVDIDEKSIRQVLLNAVSNAIKVSRWRRDASFARLSPPRPGSLFVCIAGPWVHLHCAAGVCRNGRRSCHRVRGWHAACRVVGAAVLRGIGQR